MNQGLNREGRRAGQCRRGQCRRGQCRRGQRPRGQRRRGQGIAEYGLILVLVALACFLGLTSMGESNDRFYTSLSENVDDVTAGSLGEGDVGSEGGNEDIFG